MKLISSSETLDFLSKVAPRPWVKRMLLWMISCRELKPIFLQGRIETEVFVGEYLKAVRKDDDVSLDDPALYERVREQYSEEVFEKIRGKVFEDRVIERTISWGRSDEPHEVSIGFFIFADDFNWEEGSIRTDGIPSMSREMLDQLFWDYEHHFPSDFEYPFFKAELGGLCFEFDAIEMLLPQHDAVAEHFHLLAATSPSKTTGRPRKWDWEGAMANLIGLAQRPDGLPTGNGAQAAIERMMADWFETSQGDSPAQSQIRSYAQRVMAAVERPKG